MTQATHNDMMRDFGRMESQLSALKESSDRIEAGVARMEQRLTLLEAKENQRKGALEQFRRFTQAHIYNAKTPSGLPEYTPLFATLAAAGAFRLRFRASNSTWYRGS